MTSHEATAILSRLYALEAVLDASGGSLDDLINEVRDGERRRCPEPISRALTRAYLLLGAEPETGPYCEIARSWLNHDHPIQNPPASGHQK